MSSFIFLGLNGYAWVTIVTLLAIIIVMARTRIPMEVAFLSGLTVLLVSGVVTEEEGMAGFGSEPVVIHAAFFVIIASLMHTGVMYWLSRNVLRNPQKYSHALLRLMIPVSILGALISSVNAVALLIDTVKIWAHKLKVSPSRLLLPMSYAAAMGGMCTLLGNSSNLVVAGLYLNETGETMNIFQPLVPGLILTAVGTVTIMLLHRLIPSRESVERTFENTSDYTVELLVPTDNPAVGSTVEEAGLYTIKGGSLVEIVRFDKEIIMPVPKDEWIIGGDRLIYAGQINEILELKRTHGLAAADHHVWSIEEIDTNRKMRTAYITYGSDLIGKSMTQCEFEQKNDVVLIAVARQGQRVNGQPREIQLQAGDSLLLECPPKGSEQLERETKRSLTFFDSHFVPELGSKTITSAIILILMFIASSFHLMPLMATTMLAAGLMLVFKCCRIDSIIKYIEWDILLVLGCTVVFSTAIQKTGISDTLARDILDLFGNNPYIVMAVMCLFATIVSQFVGDVATAAIFFPVMFDQATMMGCSPLPFIISLMLCANFNFSSPIGSLTNMLVYGPGSFKFSDFARVGIWLNIVLLATMLITINLIYPITFNN